MRPSLLFVPLLLGVASSCAGSAATSVPDASTAPRDAQVPEGDAGAEAQEDGADAPTEDASGSDAGADVHAAVPFIQDVLDCGKKGSAGGLAEGKDDSVLSRHDLDLTVYPDALCNDGTGAVFYYRPAPAGADDTRWIIQLQGGGNCNNGDSCAGRWCNVGTAFSLLGMSITPAPKVGIDGKGILARPASFAKSVASPFRQYNQVFVKYCSSDNWIGTHRNAVLEGHHPHTDAAVTYKVHFLGRRILEATLATLRREAGTVGSGANTLPDLDDATAVVLAGASAGGAGTVQNADYVEGLLRASNADLADYRVIIDSAYRPDLEEVGFENSPFCDEAGLCTGAAFLEAGAAEEASNWGAVRDESCLEAHAGDAWRCSNETHVMENHITAPFFVRMGLIDSLVSDPFAAGVLTGPGGATYDLALFAEMVAAGLRALPAIGGPGGTAEETIAEPPGAFGPWCPKHETLRSDEDVYEVTIEDPASASGAPTTMFEALARWTSGEATAVVSPDEGASVCPPGD